MTRQFIKFEDSYYTNDGERQFISAIDKANEWLIKEEVIPIKWQFFQQTMPSSEMTYDAIVLEYEI